MPRKESQTACEPDVRVLRRPPACAACAGRALRSGSLQKRCCDASARQLSERPRRRPALPDACCMGRGYGKAESPGEHAGGILSQSRMQHRRLRDAMVEAFKDKFKQELQEGKSVKRYKISIKSLSDRWRYRYPEFDTTQRWVKVASQVLSDIFTNTKN